MPTLSRTLSDLDWPESAQQEAVLQIMNFYGCFSDALPTSLLSTKEIEALETKEISMAEVNQAMQVHLKRPANTERAMLGYDARLMGNQILNNELMSRYDALGMLHEITPAYGANYDAILLLGASQARFASRLNYLIEIENSLQISGPIYALGSDRELWPIDEQKMTELLAQRADMSEEDVHSKFAEHLAINPTRSELINKARADIYNEFRAKGVMIPTEAHMMNALIEESVLGDRPHVKIEATKRADGSRANTEDTIVKFLEFYQQLHPKKSDSKILVISSQPEALYQIEPVKKILTAALGFGRIDLAAKAAPADTNNLAINDAIARIVCNRLDSHVFGHTHA